MDDRRVGGTAGARAAGILFRADPALETYYQLRWEPGRQRIVYDRWPRSGDQPFTLEALYRTFENDGSFAYELDRARLRAAWDCTELFGIAAEWDLDDYAETARTYGTGADFKANRYGLYLRIHK